MGLGTLKRYLEIKQIRAYTFTNLVGNVGGYMGLFLGYAVLNFPKLIIELFSSTKRIIFKQEILSPRHYDERDV